jgi:nitrogen regulatory protein PII
LAASRAVEKIDRAAQTGKIENGKLFVSPMEEVMKTHTGEKGEGHSNKES